MRAESLVARVVFPSATDVKVWMVNLLFYILGLCVLIMYVCLFNVLASR
jgi:hypothetical protein